MDIMMFPCMEVKSSFFIQGMDSDGSYMNYYNPVQSQAVIKEQLELSEEVMDYEDSNIDHDGSRMEVFERIKEKLGTLYSKHFLYFNKSAFDSVRFYADFTF